MSPYIFNRSVHALTRSVLISSSSRPSSSRPSPSFSPCRFQGQGRFFTGKSFGATPGKFLHFSRSVHALTRSVSISPSSRPLPSFSPFRFQGLSPDGEGIHHQHQMTTPGRTKRVVEKSRYVFESIHYSNLPPDDASTTSIITTITNVTITTTA